jgi:hypothetical protein
VSFKSFFKESDFLFSMLFLPLSFFRVVAEDVASSTFTFAVQMIGSTEAMDDTRYGFVGFRMSLVVS